MAAAGAVGATGGAIAGVAALMALGLAGYKMYRFHQKYGKLENLKHGQYFSEAKKRKKEKRAKVTGPMIQGLLKALKQNKQPDHDIAVEIISALGLKKDQLITELGRLIAFEGAIPHRESVKSW